MTENRIAYTVTCRIARESKARAWLAWLRDSHIAQVKAGGASDVEIVELDRDDNPGAVYQLRYHFASRAAYENYLEHHFPQLREESLSRFPPEDGFKYSRTIGQVLT